MKNKREYWTVRKGILSIALLLLLLNGCEEFGQTERMDVLPEPRPVDIESATIDSSLTDAQLEAIIEVIGRIPLGVDVKVPYRISKIEATWPDFVVAAKVVIQGQVLVLTRDARSNWQVVGTYPTPEARKEANSRILEKYQQKN